MTDKMYCPRCSKQFSGETSYCRTCGLALDGVSDIVSGEAANAPEVSTQPSPKLVRLSIGLFILGTVIGLASIVVKEAGLFPDIYGKIVFFGFIIAALLSMGMAFVFPAPRYKKRKRPAHADEASPVITGDLSPGQLPEAGFAPLVPAGPGVADERESVMIDRGSVTEHTTRNLD